MCRNCVEMIWMNDPHVISTRICEKEVPDCWTWQGLIKDWNVWRKRPRSVSASQDLNQQSAQSEQPVRLHWSELLYALVSEVLLKLSCCTGMYWVLAFQNVVKRCQKPICFGWGCCPGNHSIRFGAAKWMWHSHLNTVAVKILLRFLDDSR